MLLSVLFIIVIAVLLILEFNSLNKTEYKCYTIISNVFTLMSLAFLFYISFLSKVELVTQYLGINTITFVLILLLVFFNKNVRNIFGEKLALYFFFLIFIISVLLFYVKVSNPCDKRKLKLEANLELLTNTIENYKKMNGKYPINSKEILLMNLETEKYSIKYIPKEKNKYELIIKIGNDSIDFYSPKAYFIHTKCKYFKYSDLLQLNEK